MWLPVLRRLGSGVFLALLLLVVLRSGLSTPAQAYTPADASAHSAALITSTHYFPFLKLPPPRHYLPLVVRPRSALPPRPPFGLQMERPLDVPQAMIATAVESGARWMRWPVSWRAVEPANVEPARYNYASLDSSILSVTGEGIRLVVTIGGNPAWASRFPNGLISPTMLPEFVQFTAALAERYDGDGFADAPGHPVVDDWEFYNEPDGANAGGALFGGQPYWGPFGQQYAEMLCAVRPAMQAANPWARVWLGGLAYDWWLDQGGGFSRTFIDDVLRAGGGRCMDVYNFHYYPAYTGWDQYGSGLIGKANYLRAKFDAAGFAAMPAAVTEAGWASGNFGGYESTPEIQASYAVRFLVQSMAIKLEAVMWWAFQEPQPIETYGPHGLLDSSLQPKPAYFAYREAARRLGSAQFDHRLSQEEGAPADAEVYQFRTPATLYVMWTTGADRQVSLPGTTVEVRDMLGGNAVRVYDGDDGSADGRVSVAANWYPRYVEVVP